MKKITQLHEEFINSARKMNFGKLPITPKHPDVPLVATDRWMITGDPKTLVKNYVFSSTDQRNEFVMNLLSYESKVQHNACLTIEEDKVHVALITKNISVVTEIDKEYASYCDILYKDIVYSPLYDGQGHNNTDTDWFENSDE